MSVVGKDFPDGVVAGEEGGGARCVEASAADSESCMIDVYRLAEEVTIRVLGAAAVVQVYR